MGCPTPRFEPDEDAMQIGMMVEFIERRGMAVLYTPESRGSYSQYHPHEMILFHKISPTEFRDVAKFSLSLVIHIILSVSRRYVHMNHCSRIRLAHEAVEIYEETGAQSLVKCTDGIAMAFG